MRNSKTLEGIFSSEETDRNTQQSQGAYKLYQVGNQN